MILYNIFSSKSTMNLFTKNTKLLFFNQIMSEKNFIHYAADISGKPEIIAPPPF
jgi:hypothetical protein